MTAQTILPANSVTGGYEVSNSLRFNSGDSPSMADSVSSNGNVQFSIFSCWVKRGDLGTNQTILNYHIDANNTTQFGFNDDDKLIYHVEEGNSAIVSLISNAVFRDTSAWYHVMLVQQQNASSAADRIKIMANGARLSLATSTIPSDLSSNYWVAGNSDWNPRIGFNDGADNNYFDGYLTEVVFLDGQTIPNGNDANYTANDNSTVEFDEDSGILKPKSPAGLSFGTNGYYLNFKDSSALGNDTNGSNNFAVTNIAATDQSTDTCTNNFATMLPLTKSTDATLSEGNLNVTYGTASTRRAIFGSVVVTAGKWFCETKVIATSQTSVEMSLGISNTYNPEAIGNALVSANGFTVSLFPSNGSLYIGSTRDEQGLGNLAVNDIVGMAIDMDNGTLQFYKNGSALGSANDITTGDSDDGELYPGFTIANSCSSGGQTFTASHNFGSPAYSESGGNSDASGFGNFSMSVPSGFFSICTKNLAEYGG